MSGQAAKSGWTLIVQGNMTFTRPKIEVLRAIMLNHWYHHCGQLSVYLHMLDVPVPVIYGRSADEGPFPGTTSASTRNRAGDPALTA